MTLNEGIFWLLQQPDALERNRCFMTIGSRLRKDSGKLDARAPALWTSNGTGRDGSTNRDAPGFDEALHDRCMLNPAGLFAKLSLAVPVGSVYQGDGSAGTRAH